MKQKNSAKTFVCLNFKRVIIIFTSMTFGLDSKGLAQATSDVGGPCKIQIPVPSYSGYCYCVTDKQSGDGVCVSSSRWDAYLVCGGLTDPNTQSGKTTCIDSMMHYGRQVICTRETNWANLATFLGTGIGTGSIIGALYGSPTGPVTAAVTGAAGGAVGGAAVLIGAFGCPVRTCTSTDGRTFPVPAVGVYGGDDCRNIDGKR